MYLVGIDGGATKTLCLIGDERGTVLSSGLSYGSNHQVIGKEQARASIQHALNEALEKLNLTVNQIDYAVLGLAGADLPSDFTVLDEICHSIFHQAPFKIINDAWIGLRAGNPDNWGVVSICGTGANAAGRTQDGREAILRGMSYELGNRGGGIDLLKDALHYAFRSEEGTGPQTLLALELPKLLGLSRMQDLVETVLSQQVAPEIIYAIPILVFNLATQGDRVCQDLLVNMGRTLGEMAGGVIKRLGFAPEAEVPVTLVGSLFKGSNPLLLDEYTTTVHRVAPRARIEVAKAEPAYGAYLLALDHYASAAS